MRGWIDVQPDHVTPLADKLGIGRELELSNAMGLQPMRAPDTLNRADADPTSLGHHRGGPVRRFGRGVGQRVRPSGATREGGQRESHDALDDIAPQRRNAGGPRLVAQQEPLPS